MMCSVLISPEQLQQYHDEAYFVLPDAISEKLLVLLRDVYEQIVKPLHAEMDRRGTDAIGVNRRDRQYLFTNCYAKHPILGRFLFSDVMADICRATRGTEAFLLHDQFVVKGPGMAMPFEWHQDGGCIAHDHRPYLICWCANDDVDTDNGAVQILPFSFAGTRERVRHKRDPRTGQPVGYFGSEPGVAIKGGAGVIGVYSSLSFHRSGPNRSNRFRAAIWSNIRRNRFFTPTV